MKLEINDEKLIFQPTQIIEVDNAVVLKRGITQMKIDGDMAFDIIKVIATLTSGEGATEDELLEYFGVNDENSIKSIIDAMKAKKMLSSDNSKIEYGFKDDAYNHNIFYESLDTQKKRIENLHELKISIIGVNTISKQMGKLLKESQLHNFNIVDNPLFRNVSFFTESGNVDIMKWDNMPAPVDFNRWVDELPENGIDILICTSDFGGMQLMRDFNKFCVENNILFLPVILQDFVGYIGPLVIPGETACFECLLNRQNSNSQYYKVKRAVELSAFEGQLVTGFHPTMSSILADIAVMELIKFYVQAQQTWNVGHLIEVNLFKTEVKSKKVLKVPRCMICSEMNHISKVTTSKSTFNPVHE